jgi:hypothetical protein
MGMGVSDLQLIIELKRQGHIPNRGAIVEIGAQQLNESLLSATAEIEASALLFNGDWPPPPFLRSEPRNRDDTLAGAPLTRDFWTWLGLEYASIDLDGTPGSIPLDLNYDEVPVELAGRYHLVTNLGTTEHTANQVQAFKIIHDLASVDAVMFHNVPAGGMINHGLISYNPKFFWRLARSNGYKTLYMSMGLSHEPSKLLPELLDELAEHDLSLPSRFAAYRVPESALIVAFQKMYDAPFVAPLDLSSDATTDHEPLRERYWTVFQPGTFELLEREREIRAQRLRDVAEKAAREAQEWELAERSKIMPRLLALVRQVSKSTRSAAFRHSPTWLISAKRWLFGITPTAPDQRP